MSSGFDISKLTDTELEVHSFGAYLELAHPSELILFDPMTIKLYWNGYQRCIKRILSKVKGSTKREVMVEISESAPRTTYFVGASTTKNISMLRFSLVRKMAPTIPEREHLTDRLWQKYYQPPDNS